MKVKVLTIKNVLSELSQLVPESTLRGACGGW